AGAAPATTDRATVASATVLRVFSVVFSTLSSSCGRLYGIDPICLLPLLADFLHPIQPRNSLSDLPLLSWRGNAGALYEIGVDNGRHRPAVGVGDKIEQHVGCHFAQPLDGLAHRGERRPHVPGMK